MFILQNLLVYVTANQNFAYGLNCSQAFQCLDPENKGYVEIELLRANLTNDAGGLKEREFADFLEFAKDRDTGDTGTKIYYEDYVVNCGALVDKHLNDLYRDARAPKRN
jgi:Ca2+-binding EF-hand superfamily protein